MTSDEIVYNTISDMTGVPGARMSWGPRHCRPSLPYFVYKRESGGEVYADDSTHAIMPRYRVTLYVRDPGEAVEERFVRAVGKLGPYSRSWEYDTDHEAYVTHFDFTFTGGEG